MVGGLVKEKNIAGLNECGSYACTALLAARKGADIALLVGDTKFFQYGFSFVFLSLTQADNVYYLFFSSLS